ncbi:hypothetical protein DFP94_1011120 [Fontibacillus phaseoli]|uniref:Uncharacterized protein n=1 Tax=Fontibacillus phaseoli TaxID=1416533 RepID=A0A369BQ55_9BACL|nr:hypothetical protein DFP94_1011120 [Fontibacillus phaseoli]
MDSMRITNTNDIISVEEKVRKLQNQNQTIYDH